jgi:Raf kinase inhibitor-like YbhB/YbcL family protein
MAMELSTMVLSLVVKSAAFADGQAIPKEYTCEGKDEAPRIEIEGMPPIAKSWALIVDDPDAPSGTFVHWVIWNLPEKFHTVGPSVPKIGELPDGARQGKNDFRKLGWNGPCPPPGKLHHYHFRVFALDGKLALPVGALASDVERAVRGHVLAEGQLVGTFQR